VAGDAAGDVHGTQGDEGRPGPGTRCHLCMKGTLDSSSKFVRTRRNTFSFTSTTFRKNVSNFLSKAITNVRFLGTTGLLLAQ
jgi:hypothetical protein